MTLRDYFAAKAMAGDWANPDEGLWPHNTSSELLSKRAELYYRMADAMLAERSK